MIVTGAGGGGGGGAGGGGRITVCVNVGGGGGRIGLPPTFGGALGVAAPFGRRCGRPAGLAGAAPMIAATTLPWPSQSSKPPLASPIT